MDNVQKHNTCILIVLISNAASEFGCDMLPDK
jgi:hypothetical protein